MFKVTTLLLSLILVSACQMTPKQQNSGWFLRAEFTWWEARPEFLFKLDDTKKKLSLDFPLQPDGKPYHLKIADKLWSQGKNCGAAIEKGSQLELGKWQAVSCPSVMDAITPLNNSFLFKPLQAGTYRLEIKLTDGLPSELMLTVMSN